MKASLSPDGSSPEDILQQSAQHEGVVAGGPSTSETLFRHKPDQQPLGTDETLFQSIAANVPGMVYQFLLHPDGTVEWPFISEGCRAIYEKEPDELRRNPSWVIDIIHPDDRAEFHRSVAASAETQRADLFLHQHPLKFLINLSQHYLTSFSHMLLLPFHLSPFPLSLKIISQFKIHINSY
jgi:hypothetical protein